VRVHSEKLSNLIGCAYEAAVRPELWRAVLHDVSEAFDAEGASLFAWPYSEENAVWSKGLDDLAEQFFANGWHTRNIRLSRAQSLYPSKPVYTETDLFSGEELDTLPFNAKLINPCGFRWFVGCFLGSDSNTLTAFSLERKTEHGPFDADTIETLQTCLPHMQRIAEISMQLADAHGAGMLDAFEKMNRAAILIDGSGKVRCLNPRAKRYVGADIQILHQQLTASHRDANDALQQLIADLLQPVQVGARPKIVATLPRHDGRHIFAYGIPVVRSAQDIFRHSRVLIVLVTSDEQINPPELILRRGFKLTPAETRLALALAQGCKLDDYAETHKVCIGTVRIQLKSVMAKTSTHRQAELVSLLAQYSQALPNPDG
jgi:DNA-binding CsgD family transcriptional regulator